MREYLAQRSLYHLKEADPQAWALPRLHGAAQAAFVTVEFDEYGDGHADRAHARLFADMMADLGLDPGYGRYLDAAGFNVLLPAGAAALAPRLWARGFEPRLVEIGELLKACGGPKCCVLRLHHGAAGNDRAAGSDRVETTTVRTE